MRLGIVFGLAVLGLIFLPSPSDAQLPVDPPACAIDFMLVFDVSGSSQFDFMDEPVRGRWGIIDSTSSFLRSLGPWARSGVVTTVPAFDLLDSDHAEAIQFLYSQPYRGDSTLDKEILDANEEYFARGVDINPDVMVLMGDQGISPNMASTVKGALNEPDIWTAFLDLRHDGFKTPWTAWESSASDASQAYFANESAVLNVLYQDMSDIYPAATYMADINASGVHDLPGWGHHEISWTPAPVSPLPDDCPVTYNLYRSDDGGPFELVADKLTSTTYRDGYVPCKAHQWYVAVSLGESEGARSNIVNYTPPVGTLDLSALERFVGTPYVDDAVYDAFYDLDWALKGRYRPDCIEAFELQREEGQWSTVATTSATERAVTDGPVPCAEYQWRIRPHLTWTPPQGAGPGAWNGPADNGQKNVPNAPSVTAELESASTLGMSTGTMTQMRVEWTRPADNACPIQSYDIQRRYLGNLLGPDNPLLSTGWEDVATVYEVNDSWTDSHFASILCDVFAYRVRATNDVGPGAWSMESRAVYQPVLPDEPACYPCEEIQNVQMEYYDSDTPMDNPLCFRTTTWQTDEGLAVPGTDRLGTVNDMAVDARGFVYVVGDEAKWAPAPNGAFPLHNTAPFTDRPGAYMAIFDPSGSRVEYATYLPGETADAIELLPGPTPDSPVEVLVAGTTAAATPCSNGGHGCPPPPGCSDGKDNDNDGRTDFPDDPECKSATDSYESMNGAYPTSAGSDLYVVRFTPFHAQAHQGTYYGDEGVQRDLRLAYDPITDRVALGAVSDSADLPVTSSGPPAADASPDVDVSGGNMDGGELERRSPLYTIADHDTLFVVMFDGTLSKHLAGPTFFDDDLQGAFSDIDDAGYRCPGRHSEVLGGLAFVPSFPGSNEPTSLAVAESFHSITICWHLVDATPSGQRYYHNDEYWQDWTRICIDEKQQSWVCEPADKKQPWNTGMAPPCNYGQVEGSPYRYSDGSPTVVFRCVREHPCWESGPTVGSLNFMAHRCGWYQPVTMVHHLDHGLTDDRHTYWIRAAKTLAMDTDALGDLYLTGEAWSAPRTPNAPSPQREGPMYTSPDAYDATGDGRTAFMMALAHPWGPDGTGGALAGPKDKEFTDYDGKSYHWGPQPVDPYAAPGSSTPGIIHSTFFGSGGSSGRDIHVSEQGFVSITGSGVPKEEILDREISEHSGEDKGFISVWGPRDPAKPTWTPRYAATQYGSGGTAVYRVDHLGGVHAAGFTGGGSGDTSIQIGGAGTPAGQPGHPVSPFPWSGGGACDHVDSLCAPGPSYVYWLGGWEEPCWDDGDFSDCPTGTCRIVLNSAACALPTACSGSSGITGAAQCVSNACQQLGLNACGISFSCADPTDKLVPQLEVTGYEQWCQNGGRPDLCAEISGSATACISLSDLNSCQAQALVQGNPQAHVDCVVAAIDQIYFCAINFAKYMDPQRTANCVASGFRL